MTAPSVSGIRARPIYPPALAGLIRLLHQVFCEAAKLSQPAKQSPGSLPSQSRRIRCGTQCLQLDFPTVRTSPEIQNRKTH